ncbi:MAG: hypothetical protein ACLRIT_10200 [Blautia sp.]
MMNLWKTIKNNSALHSFPCSGYQCFFIDPHRLFAIFTHVFLPDMLDLWDFPTLLIYIGICCSLVLLSGKRHKQEIIHFLRKIVVPVGCICPLLGINQFIHQFRDPADIGSFVNQCVLFVLYSLISYVILVLIEQHLDK